MFFLRSAMAVGAIVMILPTAGDQDLAEPFQLMKTLAASRAIAGDIGSVCVRNPGACDAAHASAAIIAAKLETAATIVAASVNSWATGRSSPPDSDIAAAPNPACNRLVTGSIGHQAGNSAENSPGHASPLTGQGVTGRSMALPRPRPVS
ncbi:MAG: hypothetical protein ACTSSQ_02035 [Alphaproteobacteria bacterium]